MTTKKRANTLWDELLVGFSNIEKTIRNIIAERAWEPLGFETFSAAWDDRMRDVNLANSVKPYVIYAMLDEGQLVEDIVEATGWGQDQVERAAEDHGLGVPVEGATVVRRHWRRAPSASHTLHVGLSQDEYQWIRGIASAQDRDLSEEARAAVIAHFEHLKQHPRARRAS